MADTSPRQRLSIFVCLGLMLIYPLFAVSVQKATASLAGSVGEIEARTITEGAIWL
jgi:hypothetical protein